MTRTLRWLRSRRLRAGSAAVEFGLIAPVFIVVMFGVTDWGLALEQRMRLLAAARAGAQVALDNPTNEGSAITNAVNTAASGMTSLSVTPSTLFCECDGVRMTSCTASCGGTIASFVTINVSRPYARITPAGPTSIAASVTVQIN